MQDDVAQRQALLQAQLEALVTAHVGVEHQPLFRSFMAAYFEMSSQAALTARTPEQLFHIAQQHWMMAFQRRIVQSMAVPASRTAMAMESTRNGMSSVTVLRAASPPDRVGGFRWIRVSSGWRWKAIMVRPVWSLCHFPCHPTVAVC